MVAFSMFIMCETGMELCGFHSHPLKYPLAPVERDGTRTLDLGISSQISSVWEDLSLRDSLPSSLGFSPLPPKSPPKLHRAHYENSPSVSAPALAIWTRSELSVALETPTPSGSLADGELHEGWHLLFCVLSWDGAWDHRCPSGGD